MKIHNKQDYDITLSVAEIAKLLKISKSKAYELVRQSTFPKIRIGKRIIIPRDNFFDWLDRETRRGASK